MPCTELDGPVITPGQTFVVHLGSENNHLSSFYEYDKDFSGCIDIVSTTQWEF